MVLEIFQHVEIGFAILLAKKKKKNQRNSIANILKLWTYL